MALKPKNGMKLPPNAKPTVNCPKNIGHRSLVLSHLADVYDWSSGVEIGTAHGRTTERILTFSPNLQLLTVDLWQPQPGNEGPEDWADWDHANHELEARKRLAKFGDRVRIYKGWSKAAAKTVEPGSVDFVFIDGDHSTAAVIDDVKTWRRKIKPGGMLTGHDINWPTVKAAMKALKLDYEIWPDNVWTVQA